MSSDLSWQDHISREELIRRLRILARKEMTYRQMAASIGLGITKDAVAGICRRAKPPIITEGAMEQAALRSGDVPAQPAAPTPVLIGRAPRFFILDEVEPDSVHLMALRQGVLSQCRAPLWPDRIGTRTKVQASEAHFCGKKVRPNSSYCPEHHPQFWVKPAPKHSHKNAERARMGQKKRRLEREVAGE